MMNYSAFFFRVQEEHGKKNRLANYYLLTAYLKMKAVW